MNPPCRPYNTSRMKMTVFWDVAPCSLIEIDRRFKGVYFKQQAPLSLFLPNDEAQHPKSQSSLHLSPKDLKFHKSELLAVVQLRVIQTSLSCCHGLGVITQCDCTHQWIPSWMQCWQCPRTGSIEASWGPQPLRSTDLLMTHVYDTGVETFRNKECVRSPITPITKIISARNGPVYHIGTSFCSWFHTGTSFL
jgi:hypothetical protein